MTSLQLLILSGMLVMAGDTAKLHRLSIDPENSTGRVHLAETDAVFPRVLQHAV